MKLLDVTSRKSWIIIVIIILILLIVYFILQFYIFQSDPVIRFLLSGINSYLLLIEKFSNHLLQWIGSGVTIDNHLIVHINEQFYVIDSDVIMKKWAVLLLLIFWITQTSARKKILFTGILIIANFLSVSIDLTFIALLTGSGYDYNVAHLISRTFGVLVMTTIFFIWVRNHETSILNSLSKRKLNTDLIKSKIPSLIIVLYIYAIAGNLVWGYFDFKLWINFLFKATQKILLVLGEEVTVEPNYLIGTNGSLFMLRTCLGFHTIFLFASLVYLTGTENIKRWIYIAIGVLFLNVVNIIRLVLLFMHVQKFGSYQLAIDVHDMYTYITYIIVFILWVIWFEFFTDIKSIFKGRVDKS